MFLHLGNNFYIFQKDIVAICNLDTTTVSKNTQMYLKKCEDSNIIESVSTDIPKSFVLIKKTNPLCNKGIQKNKNLVDREKIYLTNISSSTLLKRLETDI